MGQKKGQYKCRKTRRSSRHHKEERAFATRKVIRSFRTSFANDVAREKSISGCVRHVRISWDVEFVETMVRNWENWHQQMPENYEVPRSLAPYQQPVSAMTLHTFGDASKTGVAAAAKQPNGTNQGSVFAKSRLAKRNLTIPRLELVAGNMAIKLATNVERAINQNRVKAVHCWLDSTVALYQINGQGDFHQFVANRVAKIQEHNHVKWHHVSTHANPADLGIVEGKLLAMSFGNMALTG